MQKNQNRLETVLLLLPFLIIALLWSRLPAVIPAHWNFRGEIDRWASRPSLFLLPAISLALNALLRALQWLDPKLRRSDDIAPMTAVLRKLRLALAVFFVLLCFFQIVASLGHAVRAGRLILILTLILFGVIGNYLGNLRPNYFAGIRTPWTLESAQTWRATHRHGGRLMFFGALVLAVAQFLTNSEVFAVLFCVALLSFVAWCFIYSWRYFQSHETTR